VFAFWTLAFGILVCVVVYAVSGGHAIFLPLLFIPLGLFWGGARRRRGSR
jgi:hypothetical protein